MKKSFQGSKFSKCQTLPEIEKHKTIILYNVDQVYFFLFNFIIISFLAIDECANKSHGCDAHAKCTNTISSCRCLTGYSGNGKSCAKCPTGYAGDGISCTGCLFDTVLDNNFHINLLI